MIKSPRETHPFSVLVTGAVGMYPRGLIVDATAHWVSVVEVGRMPSWRAIQVRSGTPRRRRTVIQKHGR